MIIKNNGYYAQAIEDGDNKAYEAYDGTTFIQSRDYLNRLEAIIVDRDFEERLIYLSLKRQPHRPLQLSAAEIKKIREMIR